MKRLPSVIRAAAVSVAIVSSMLGVGGAPSSPVMGTPAEAQVADALPCGLSQPAFCDTFDQPAGTGNRSGQLNGTLWGVSRIVGAMDFGQGQYNAAPATRLVTCGGTATVTPPNDVIICNGQVREASNDNASGAFEAGGVTSLAMYPKQPFDFAGRTGKVTFDVGNDSHGSHAVWPEFWITDKPVPAPFTHFGTLLSLPQFGFGLRFSGSTNSVGAEASCPEGAGYVGVNSVVVVNNYAANDSENAGSIKVHGLDCVTKSTQAGQLNHYEIDVAQNQLDVYGTDAGTTAPLKHLATVANANLGFTHGLVWLEDVHYNADKADITNPSASQRQHTFVWDNLGFDGPVLARDLTFDVLDGSTAGAGGLVNLGWLQAPNAAVSKTVPGVTNVADASAAMLMFNFYHYAAPTTFTYVVNGQSHTAAWPYPDSVGYTWRTLALPVPLAEVQTGTNTVSVTSNQAMVVANVDILLVAAGGGGGASIPAPPAPQAEPTPAPAAAAPTPAPPAPAPASPPAVAAENPLPPILSRAAVGEDGVDLAANQFSFSVPAGVVGPRGGEFNLVPLDPQSVPAPAGGVQPTDTAFVVALTDASTGTQISQPSSALVLLYRLSQGEINQAGGDPSRFQIVNWSGDEWVSLGCTADAAGLDCAVPHLGLFALVVASLPSDTPDAQPSDAP